MGPVTTQFTMDVQHLDSNTNPFPITTPQSHVTAPTTQGPKSHGHQTTPKLEPDLPQSA